MVLLDSHQPSGPKISVLGDFPKPVTAPSPYWPPKTHIFTLRRTFRCTFRNVFELIQLPSGDPSFVFNCTFRCTFKNVSELILLPRGDKTFIYTSTSGITIGCTFRSTITVLPYPTIRCSFRWILTFPHCPKGGTSHSSCTFSIALWMYLNIWFWPPSH